MTKSPELTEQLEPLNEWQTYYVHIRYLNNSERHSVIQLTGEQVGILQQSLLNGSEIREARIYTVSRIMYVHKSIYSDYDPAAMQDLTKSLIESSGDVTDYFSGAKSFSFGDAD